MAVVISLCFVLGSLYLVQSNPHKVPSTKYKDQTLSRIQIQRPYEIETNNRSVGSVFPYVLQTIAPFLIKEWGLPRLSAEARVSNVHQAKSSGRSDMKRLLALIAVLTVLVITGTIVSAYQ